MVILDLASRITASVRVFTLDTGRLPDETYRMVETVRQRYGMAVEIVFPERDEVEELVAIQGPNLFYSDLIRGAARTRLIAWWRRCASATAWRWKSSFRNAMRWKSWWRFRGRTCFIQI